MALATAKIYKRRILTGLIGAAIVSGALLLLVRTPWQRYSDELRQQIDHKRQTFNRLLENRDMAYWLNRMRAMETNHRQLRATWTQATAKAKAFDKSVAMGLLLSSAEEDRIDYKVALFEARTRLRKLAEENNVSLPANLGVPDMLGTDEDMVVRLWQLASAIHLLKTGIQLEIPVIEHIEAMPPLIIPLQSVEQPALVVYPMAILMTCSYDKWLSFLQALQTESSFFSIQRFWLERDSMERNDRLRVFAICEAIVFEQEAIPHSAQTVTAEKAAP